MTLPTLTLSASTLDKLPCHRRYWLYKIAHRKSSASKSGADAGTCLHSAFRLWNHGAPVDAQEAVIDVEREARPLAFEEDWRTAGYLKDAFAMLRAELSGPAATWQRLEVERRGSVEVGQINGTLVMLEYRRDLVVESEGDVWVVDLKSSMRDEAAEVRAYQNSGQAKAYAWSWNVEHPDTPCKGVQFIRLIMRKPSKTGVPFEVKIDPPVRFADGILAEWQTATLRRARDILERDPNDPNDWPMADSGAGLCRNQWGCCEYLDVCTLAPADRALKLSTDAFVDSDFGKEPVAQPQETP